MKYCSGLEAGTGTAVETADAAVLDSMALDTMSLDTAAAASSSFTSKENVCAVPEGGVGAPVSGPSTENDPSKASAAASPFTPLIFKKKRSGILSLPWPRIH